MVIKGMRTWLPTLKIKFSFLNLKNMWNSCFILIFPSILTSKTSSIIHSRLLFPNPTCTHTIRVTEYAWLQTSAHIFSFLQVYEWNNLSTKHKQKQHDIIIFDMNAPGNEIWFISYSRWSTESTSKTMKLVK